MYFPPRPINFFHSLDRFLCSIILQNFRNVRHGVPISCSTSGNGTQLRTVSMQVKLSTFQTTRNNVLVRLCTYIYNLLKNNQFDCYAVRTYVSFQKEGCVHGHLRLTMYKIFTYN